MQVPRSLTAAPGRWGHLTARFFDVITSRSLSPGEERMVDEWLGGGPVSQAFFAQPTADQRHGYAAARHVLSVLPDRSDLVRAALLHDIGKRHARLGPVGRVFATLAQKLGLPLTRRMRLYRDHGQMAAAELSEDLPVVVEFARHHHGARPPSISAADWEVLQSADGARRPLRGGR